MGQGHDHGLGEVKHERPLWWALGLTAGFLAAEIIGGLLSNSLALLSDAAHMATDTAGLVIALVAVRLSRRPPDARRTFGYARLEALGALANGVLLFAVAGYILWEAIGRFRTPPPVSSLGMFVVAIAGLIINLIAMRLLKAGSGESLNVKGAYLEVWSDMLGSIAVLIAAIVMRFTGWLIVDPILAVLIGLWVLPRTWKLVGEAVNVLLEGVPQGIDIEQVQKQFLDHPEVKGVHDLHVWSLATREPALTAHVELHDGADSPDAVRIALVSSIAQKFAIHRVTLQVERDACHREVVDDHRGHDHDHNHDH